MEELNEEELKGTEGGASKAPGSILLPGYDAHIHVAHPGWYRLAKAKYATFGKPTITWCQTMVGGGGTAAAMRANITDTRLKDGYIEIYVKQPCSGAKIQLTFAFSTSLRYEQKVKVQFF